MSIAGYSKFNMYKEQIFSLSTPLEDDVLLSEAFLLEKDEKKPLEIYYAPFEYVNEQAKVVIVGITPGLFQMKQSYSTVINAKDQLTDNEEILREVKNNSSFQGPMRKNLIMMLDELQLHKHLGLLSTNELFSTASNLVQTTSLLPYPVFYRGKNYSGSTPNMLKTELLKKYVINYFAAELKSMDNPLIIPLGVNVSKVLNYLAESNYIESNSILNGFPHPSGGNGHRHKQFSENKDSMIEQLEAYFKKSKSRNLEFGSLPRI
ncbi:hypothetical protein CWR48_03100 [Oceanobacillus arenosus]|uniref:Uracil-DNA glycosylase-like domain-containing protein n=1 Tax=Oceanobacillus arenosus TaxID=1229153 RepID=A0A3D8PZ16_9BACI|nr:uracil-DNA glycosylase family protein [Oceanobacillus arenosus]RDW21406.1 hypothetical protein CWR48_03100 [Oceanobacillus arenosus]